MFSVLFYVMCMSCVLSIVSVSVVFSVSSILCQCLLCSQCHSVLVSLSLYYQLVSMVLSHIFLMSSITVSRSVSLVFSVSIYIGVSCILFSVHYSKLLCSWCPMSVSLMLSVSVCVWGKWKRMKRKTETES